MKKIYKNIVFSSFMTIMTLLLAITIMFLFAKPVSKNFELEANVGKDSYDDGDTVVIQALLKNSGFGIYPVEILNEEIYIEVAEGDNKLNNIESSTKKKLFIPFAKVKKSHSFIYYKDTKYTISIKCVISTSNEIVTLMEYIYIEDGTVAKK